MSGAHTWYRPAHRRRRARRVTVSPAVVVVPAGIAGLAGLAVAVPAASGPASSTPSVTTTLAAGSLAARAPQRPSRSAGRVPVDAQEPPVATLAAAAAARERPPAQPARTTPREQPQARPAAPPATVIGTRFTSTGLNVREAPSTTAALVTTLAAGTKVTITDRTQQGWRMVEVDGRPAWVAGEYLQRTRPEPQQTTLVVAGGLSAAPCATGSAVEAGLVPNAIAVHRAVCAAFPQITSYGGYRPDSGFHGSGQAVDVMVTGALGDQVAAWLQSNAGALGISELIWSQRIWTVQRAGDGWRWMSDRGSATANHYDHVHVSVY